MKPIDVDPQKMPFVRGELLKLKGCTQRALDQLFVTTRGFPHLRPRLGRHSGYLQHLLAAIQAQLAALPVDDSDLTFQETYPCDTFE